MNLVRTIIPIWNYGASIVIINHRIGVDNYVVATFDIDICCDDETIYLIEIIRINIGIKPLLLLIPCLRY